MDEMDHRTLIMRLSNKVAKKYDRKVMECPRCLWWMLERMDSPSLMVCESCAEKFMKNWMPDNVRDEVGL